MRSLPFVLACAAGALLAIAPVRAQAASAHGAGPTDRATFAGGCFWCLEADFDKVPGVVETISGYAGGQTANPTYEQVSQGGTGYAESLQVVFDPGKVSYQHLLEVYWRHIDPLDGGGQFCDRGSQYRTVIFYRNEEQKRLAEESKQLLDASGRLPRPIVTAIVPLTKFYPAEEYHQDFHIKNPVRYQTYRMGCGRDRRTQEVWGTGDLVIFKTAAPAASAGASKH